jgi:hypothetical protein
MTVGVDRGSAHHGMLGVLGEELWRECNTTAASVTLLLALVHTEWFLARRDGLANDE